MRSLAHARTYARTWSYALPAIRTRARSLSSNDHPARLHTCHVRTVQGPRIWYKTVREIVTLERMHRAFADGLMEYGMARAVKAPSAGPAAAPAAAEEQQAAA